MFEEQFDEILRDKLRDHESPVPAGLWERLWGSGFRGFGPLGRAFGRPGWWFIGLCVLGLLVGGYYWRAVHSVGRGGATAAAVRSATAAGDSRDMHPAAGSRSERPAAGSKATHTFGQTIIGTRLVHAAGRPAAQERSSNRHPGVAGGQSGVTTRDYVTASENIDIYAPTSPVRVNSSASRPGSDLPMQPPAVGSMPRGGGLVTLAALRRAARPVITQKEPRWAIDVYGSPDFGRSQAYQNDSSLFSHAGTKMKLGSSYTFGATLSRYVGSHLSVRAGLQLSSISISPPPADSSFASPIRVNSLDLPLWVGYGIGRKFRATLEGGFLIHLYSLDIQHAGQYVVFNPPASVYLGLNLAATIANHYQVFGEPYFRYLIYPGLTANGFLTFGEQKVSTIEGVSFGVRYLWGEQRKRVRKARKPH